MWMHLQEVLEGDRPIRVQRAAIELAFGIEWQSHYTKAMDILIDQKWITLHNYYGKHEYELTDQGRSHAYNFQQAARRKMRDTGWQKRMVV